MDIDADEGRDAPAGPRLRMVALTLPILRGMAGRIPDVGGFAVPADWPDGDDIAHLQRWLDAALADESAGTTAHWRAWALVDAADEMIGHAGFHGPPRPLHEALDDPTFTGELVPDTDRAVEIGYTVFAPHREQGYGTEAASALVRWAFGHDLDTVVATCQPDNGPSLTILARLGFAVIGHCIDGEEPETVLRLDRAR